MASLLQAACGKQQWKRCPDCPLLVQVWIALEEKGIPFDTILIDLFNKPEWYPEVAANGQTPAVRLDGENLCESYDILLVRTFRTSSSSHNFQTFSTPKQDTQHKPLHLLSDSGRGSRRKIDQRQIDEQK